MPAFGELESRVYSAACQNGLGTVKGTLSGMMAVDLALGQHSVLLDEFMGYEAPGGCRPSLSCRWAPT
ncbi:hypothetical protein MBH78_18230 [Oceanimonas sp. NS1]|nr:hypothetical protein [Oceanimonas sp. NS1]